MIDFEPTEEQRLVKDAVAELARGTLRTRAREFESLRAVPEDVRRTAHEMGLGLATVPESAGGQGLSLATAVLIEEELGFGDAGAAFGLAGPGAFARAVVELGTAEQQVRLLAPFAAGDGHDKFGAVAWSEAKPNASRAGFSTVARRTGDGWELTGKKAFVQNAGIADAYVVFAQVDEAKGWGGLGAFVVEKTNPGLKAGERHATLGLDAARFGEIVLESAKVAQVDRLDGGADFTRATLRFFAKQSLVVASRAVGLARAAWETTREYCDVRKAFGKPIGHFQAVAFTLADRLMDVESARAMLLRAAWLWDAGRDENEALAATANAVAHTLEAAMRCGDDGVQLHGGSGFVRDYPVEKWMRDAKQLALSALTAEQADQIFAAVALSAALDPALVLPTPDAQAIFT